MGMPAGERFEPLIYEMNFNPLTNSMLFLRLTLIVGLWPAKSS